MGGAPIMATWLIPVAALIGSILGGAVLMAIRKPFAEEIDYQIDQIPQRLFFLALWFFPKNERGRRFDQWAEDYQELSDRYEKRTLVRIYKSVRFCTSLLARSGFISRTTANLRPNKTPARREVLLLSDGRKFAVEARIGGIVLKISNEKFIVGDHSFDNKDDALKHAAQIAARIAGELKNK